MKLNFIDRLNFNNIFLADAAGAGASLLMTGGILPLIPNFVGIPRDILFALAIFPLVYSLFGIALQKMPGKQPWMLMAVIILNVLYAMILATVLISLRDIAVWGYLFMIGEIIILSVLVSIEFQIFRKRVTP